MARRSYNGFTPEQRSKAARWLRQQNPPRPTTCDACGQDAARNVTRHSEDYSEPYGPHIGAFSLCYVCHMLVHCRFSAREAYERYVGLLETGLRARPCYEWDAFTLLWLGRRVIDQATEPRTGGDPELLWRIDRGDYRRMNAQPALL